MVRSRVALIGMIILATMNMSCGRSDGPPLYPVHGKVIYKGQPAAGAVVMLRREGAAPPGTELFGTLVPTGYADDEGNFSVTLDEFGMGAPIGQYKALIQWRVKVEGNPEPAPPSKKKGRSKIVIDKPDGVADRLEGRFMKPESSKFIVDVKAEDNTLPPFDVSS